MYNDPTINTVSTTSSGKSKKVWYIVGAVVLIVIVILLASLANGLLKTAVYGPDIGTTWSPLVRHKLSDRFCYDNGSTYCEGQQVQGQKFQKEFTVGYLIRPSGGVVSGVGTKALYSCTNQTTGKHTATLDPATCNVAGQTVVKTLLGNIFTASTFEASTKLYSCQSPNRTETLLTDDANECVTRRFSPATEMGYVATAGYLTTRRLENLCGLVKTSCDSAQGSDELCAQYGAPCKLP